MNKNSSLWYYVLLVFGVFCISWSAILVKLAGVSGVSSAFYRMFFGTLGIIPIWLYYRKPIRDMFGVLIAVICGVLFASDIALWNTSIMLSKATISTLLANLAPVWVGVGALMFMKEKPEKIFWTGTALSLVGVVMIVGFQEVIHFKLNIGTLLAIVASMFYGAYILTVRKGRNSLDTFSFTAISMLSSTAVLALIALLTQAELSNFHSATWLYLIILGIVPQLLGWLAINQALGVIKPTVASVVLLSQTLFTAVFSAMVIGEVLTVTELVGGVVVLAGIYLVGKKRKLKDNVQEI